MDDSVKITNKKLQEAIESGEVLDIIYMGGSQPGAHREIVPVSIKGNKCRARCLNSHAIKLFNMEKIQVVGGHNESINLEWTSNNKPQIEINSITELLEKKGESLSLLGWSILSGEDYVSLHRRFKNEKPMKGADVSLCYEEYTYDTLYGDDGEFHEEKRRKIKPWTLRSKNKDTQSYGHLNAAVNMFIEWAANMAPAQKE